MSHPGVVKAHLEQIGPHSQKFELWEADIGGQRAIEALTGEIDEGQSRQP